MPGSYQEGKDDCKELGGHLASVSSIESLELIFKLEDKLEIMIGLAEREWDDEAHWNVEYFNNLEKEIGGAGDCVVLKGFAKIWRKVSCDEKHIYVCQLSCEY